MKSLVIIVTCLVALLALQVQASHPKVNLGNEVPEVSILTPRGAAHPEEIAFQHLGLKKKKKMLIPRSIVHDHPDGGNRTCEYEKDLISFLPSHYQVSEAGGHYHLLLSVADTQLAFLINWLALSFEMGYLPSHRVLIHFSCDGPATRNFVEEHLLSECVKDPVRVHSTNESHWRLVIKDRLAKFLTIVEALDETDWGAMTFDVDAPWIRNMIPVFDHYSQSALSNPTTSAAEEHHEHDSLHTKAVAEEKEKEKEKQGKHDMGNNYDLITQGIMIDRKDIKHDGKVLVNMGGVFIKNSHAGKALARLARAGLNDIKMADIDWPDQDYLTHALLDVSKATQEPLPGLKHLSKDSSYHNEHCGEHPNTCTHVSTGVHGTFSAPAAATGGSKRQAAIPGTYMFFPGVIAPDKCEHICSGATVMFQHCGLSNCLQEDENHHCHDIPEFVLKSHQVEKVLAFDAPKVSFKPAPHGTFDSRTLEHQMKALKKFVSVPRLIAFCEVYKSVCKVNDKGTGIMLH